MSDEQTEQDPVFGDSRDEVLRIAKILDIAHSFYTSRRADEEITHLRISLPNGRETRTISVTPPKAKDLAKSNFGSWTILGDYIAYLDTSMGFIEALTRPIARAGTNQILEIPGILFDGEDSPPDPPHRIYDDEGEPLRSSLKDEWRIPFRLRHNNSVSIELQHASGEIKALCDPFQFRQSGGASLLITGLTTDRHDEALDILDRYASALFFELDLRFDVSLEIARRRRVRYQVSDPNDILQASPLAPLENFYAEQPVSLYFYAKSASTMPLLQYLAYYQSIEFFFPSFSNSEIIKKLRYRLRDPRFDREDDAHLQNLIAMTGGTRRGTFPEKDQLKMTLDACVQTDEIREFLRANPGRLEFFEQHQKIRGVKRISFADNDKLIQQISDRIYGIRCRIVHTKENDNDSRSEALLPTGKEAEYLHHDIDLMQFVAQKVLICGSRGRLV